MGPTYFLTRLRRIIFRLQFSSINSTDFLLHKSHRLFNSSHFGYNKVENCVPETQQIAIFREFLYDVIEKRAWNRGGIFREAKDSIEM